MKAGIGECHRNYRTQKSVQSRTMNLAAELLRVPRDDRDVKKDTGLIFVFTDTRFPSVVKVQGIHLVISTGDTLSIAWCGQGITGRTCWAC